MHPTAKRLRSARQAGYRVKLLVSERCDAIKPNPRGDRTIVGKVELVTPTDAFCIVGGWHIPIEDVLRVQQL